MAFGGLPFELPGVYLDSVRLETAVDLILVNRNPEPNEVQVPFNYGINFELYDLGGVGPDQALLQVEVEGIPVVVNGVVQAPWTGSISSISSPGAMTPDGLAVAINPADPWASLQVVSVRVQATRTGGGATLDETYSFTIEDLTPPDIVSAVPLGLQVVRVTYNEPVRAQGDGASTDALTASNYDFEAQNDSVTPAVAIDAVSVSKFSDTEFDVELGIPMSPAPYLLTVSNVVDLWGNPVGPATDLFDGWVIPFPLTRQFELYRLFPQINREEDTSQDLLRFSRCLQELFNLLLHDVDRWVEIFDIDRAPEDFLDAILADLGNPFAFDLDLNSKRRLARILVEIYKLKGTAPGVQYALRFFLGLSALVLDYLDEIGWALGDGELGWDTWLGLDHARAFYSFDVLVDRVLTDAEEKQVRQIVEYMKPAHTHLIKIVEP
jgi:phage tail-like protein